MGAGVEGALEQAIGYVSDLGVTCDVVVTDGIRYRMYEASKDFELVAYANLAYLKQSANYSHVCEDRNRRKNVPLVQNRNTLQGSARRPLFSTGER